MKWGAFYLPNTWVLQECYGFKMRLFTILLIFSSYDSSWSISSMVSSSDTSVFTSFGSYWCALDDISPQAPSCSCLLLTLGRGCLVGQEASLRSCICPLTESVWMEDAGKGACIASLLRNHLLPRFPNPSTNEEDAPITHISTHQCLFLYLCWLARFWSLCILLAI